MSGILELLNSPIGKQLISGVSQQAGESEGKMGNLLQTAMPIIMGAMQRNANTPEGAQGLSQELAKHSDTGLVDNLSGFFEGGVDTEVKEQGAGLLNNILGDKQEHVTNALSQKTGIEPDKVGQTLQSVLPLVMNVLGKQGATRGQAGGDLDVSGLLGGMLGGGQGSQQQSAIEKFLDADGDGSILDDVLGMVQGAAGGTGENGQQKAGGLLGMLGGLFSKK